MQDNSAEMVIKVHNVGKVFKLPHEKHTSIKSAFVNFYRQRRAFEIQQALKDVSFEVRKGEFFGIIGRNGSGKSTLLKLLAGIYVPTKGKIQIQGHLTPFIELGVGFNPELTGRENVFLNGALLGFNRKEMQAMYKDIVKFAELQKFMDQKLKNYSSGMQVRLAFSIAIQAQSDILLIDEVLAVGDASFQAKCFNIFHELKKKGKTIVFVSHDMATIQGFCDRVIVLNQGSLVFEGAPREAVKGYLGQITEDSQKDDATPYSLDQLSHRITGKAKIYNGRIENKAGRQLDKVKAEEFIIKYDVEFLEDAEDPNPGIIIMNQYGLQISSASALWAESKTGKFKKGEKVTYAFKLHNFLESGRYKIIANLFYNDDVRIYEWENDLLSIYSEKLFKTGDIVHMPYEFSVHRLKGTTKG